MRRGVGPNVPNLPIRRSQLVKAYLFLGSSLLVIALFMITSQMVTRLSRQVETTSRVLARFCAMASFPATDDPELQRIFAEVISGIEFPMVITDTEGLPRAWRQVGVDPALVTAASLDSVSRGLPVSPVFRARIGRVRARVAELDRRNSPIEMTQPATGFRIGSVHYGDPPVLDRLRWMPFLTVGGVALLGWLGLWGVTTIRQAERRSIWVGMARETAHQLGTPLSSLLGWIELLRGRLDADPLGDEVRYPRGELDETLGEMGRDVDRLTKVAQRFSHVGSAPSLQLQDVIPVVREAVEYVRRRLPSAEGEVEIREHYEEVPPINLNYELVEWAVENLLSNAVTALEGRRGAVEIAVARRGETEAVEVVVRDNGRGMAPSEQRRAFDPGYTTKRRGWGLGLALARRVVEEYHGGRLFVRDSAPGEGTTMVMSFPT